MMGMIPHLCPCLYTGKETDTQSVMHGWPLPPRKPFARRVESAVAFTSHQMSPMSLL